LLDLFYFLGRFKFGIKKETFDAILTYDQLEENLKKFEKLGLLD